MSSATTGATAVAISSIVSEPAEVAQPAETAPMYKVTLRVNGKSRTLTLDGSGRAAFGGVAHRLWRVEDAEAAMSGGAVEMSKAVFADARPTDDDAFKIPLATRPLAAVITEVKP